jgi:hypothetical protein
MKSNIIKIFSLKLLIFVILVIIGCLLGGLYGLIHDQLTYTISNEYFTKFKFKQFGIINLPDRIAVSFIGILATWWMGLILSVILGLIGFIQKGPKRMFRYSLEAFGLTIVIAFITGLIGLLYGFMFLSSKSPEYFKYWFIPENLINFKNYIAVGSMHNFSYLGGGIGLIAGIIWLIIRKIKDKKIQIDINQ